LSSGAITGDPVPCPVGGGTHVAGSVGAFGLNKTKLVAWHKHLVKGRKYREQRRAKAAASAPATPAAKR
jgi:hypothetical protein